MGMSADFFTSPFDQDTLTYWHANQVTGFYVRVTLTFNGLRC